MKPDKQQQEKELRRKNKIESVVSGIFKKEEKDEKSKKKRTIKIYNIHQSFEEIQNLIKSRANFATEETTTSVKIKIHSQNEILILWYLENTKSDYFLIMLNKLKKEMLQNSEKIMDSKYSGLIGDINYFAFADSISEMKEDTGFIYNVENVYEADISAAYYRAALELGFISKKLYSEIVFKMSKDDRLKLMGCIATIKVFSFYKNGTMENDPIIKFDKLLRSAWFKICSHVDTAMLELKSLLKKDFLFYWVDGIYFKADPSNEITEIKFNELLISLKNNYFFDWKLVPLTFFQLINMGDYVEIQLQKPSDDEPRRFYPKKKEIKSYKLMYEHEVNI